LRICLISFYSSTSLACHRPPVPESEKQRLLSEFRSKESRGLQPKRFDWTCGACKSRNTTATPDSRLASHPASRGTPIVVDDDDDDIQIVEQPASSTGSSVISKVPQPRMASQQAESVSTSRPSAGRNTSEPHKPAPQPELITLSDDDDIELIPAAVAIVSGRHPPEQSSTKGQVATPHKDNSRAEQILPRISVTRTLDTISPQGLSSKNATRPPIQPIVQVERSATLESLGNMNNTNQSSIFAPHRSVSLSASLLAGLSDLSVENNRTAAADASPDITKQPQLLYEWIVAKMDLIELTGNTRSASSATPRRPRKATSTSHARSMAAGEPFAFSVDSWKRGKLDDLRRG
jgi:hypothetical protein